MSAGTLDLPFSPYRGDEPFAFVCYAHRNVETVYPELCWLSSQGVRIWYDEGISAGRRWHDEIAEAIDRCTSFIVFMSPDTAASPTSLKEITYALGRNKPFLAIYLEETHLSPGLSLATSDLQAIYMYRCTRSDYEHRTLEFARDLIEGLTPATPTHHEPRSHRAGLSEASGSTGSSTSSSPRTRPLWMAGILTAFVLVTATLLRGYWPPERPDLPRSIAVLPFDNFSGNPANEYLSDGIAEELVNLLEKIDGLRVVSRKASFGFKNRDADLATIASRLHADLILEGSFRREDDQIRIAAQLIDARTGLHEWSDIFEERVENVLAMQQNMARQVARAMNAVLGTNDLEALAAAPTQDPVAYSLYLEGMNYLRLASRASEFEAARSHFAEALARDPQFQFARTGICKIELALYERSNAPGDHASAIAACARLVASDVDNVDAMVALGKVNQLAGNHLEALTLFDRAIAIRPNDLPAHYGRADSLHALGDLEGAEAAWHRCLDLEPGYWLVYSGYGYFLATTGRYEEAAAHFRVITQLVPDSAIGHGNLGTALFAAGDAAGAEAAWRRSLALEATGQGYVNVGTALYHLGRLDEAIALYLEGTERFPDYYRLWGKLGAAYAETGQAEPAARAFGRAIDLAEALLRINNRDAVVMAYAGVYYARIGQTLHGIDLCREATVLAPDDPELRYLLATALRLAGRDEESGEALAAALSLGFSRPVAERDPVFAGI
jgi:TolB-like protein/Flp pilus assembly protein TadD